MEEYRRRFQELLRELFQFESADLDFGIYRIMNHKRDVVERFIEKDLLNGVAGELDRGALAQQSEAARKLQEKTEEVKNALGSDALDPSGNLVESLQKTKIGQEYEHLREEAQGYGSRPALEAMIFNHLFAFFSRYYDAGDFISKRRYSRKEKYAIPYNGEEVHLHWANSDQYYVKTGEHFTDYRFTSRGLTAHFCIQAADVEKDNVKGDERFFIPLAKDAAFDAKAKELIVPFEFRPLTEQEQTRYGQRKQQATILAEAVESIPKRFDKQHDILGALIAEHHKTAEGASVSVLEHHLRQYTQRNTSDFFIHKDLKGFLTRELDFYLKNEVLNLDELEAGDDARAEGWFQIMRAVKAIGGRVIEFLAQIEEFQKMLFEKRKFITETQYCITVGNIGAEFYPDIAANDAQWMEWKELFHIDEEEKNIFTSAAKTRKDRRIAFLKGHPTLVLDSKHFDQEFRDRLLASFEDLDEATDGLLVHSENFQALSLLMEKYREAVGAVYIDPPYNTFATKINYKNEYEHSSWLTLLENRLLLAKGLLAKDAITCTTIDDYELHRLMFVMERVFGTENHLATVAIRNNPSGRSTVKGFAVNHEYGLFFCKSAPDASVGRMPHTVAQKRRYDERDDEGNAFEWENFRKSSAGSHRHDRPHQYFPLYYDQQRKSLRIPRLEWHGATRSWKVLENPKKGEALIWPKDSAGRERVWRYGIERTLKVLSDFRVEATTAGLEVYTTKYLQQRGSLPRTWWDKPEYSARDNGTRALADLFGSERLFDFPKAPSAVMDSIRICCSRERGLVLDYFAGSGTTGHAVINMNREDDEGMRFILAEVGDSLESVILARIKKVTFSPEWKGGKPVREATEEEAERSPRIVKYIRLESYEDALNNIAFDEKAGQSAMDFDDYLLSYMLKWETKGCATMLNVQSLASPFSYKVEIVEGQNKHDKTVDLPETFAYLLGLHVKTRRAYADGGRRYLVYRGRIDHREVAVIWRDTSGWKKADYERDKKFVADQKLADDADEVFVNGDSLIPQARSLDGVFKARMFAPLGA